VHCGGQRKLIVCSAQQDANFSGRQERQPKIDAWFAPVLFFELEALRAVELVSDRSHCCCVPHYQRAGCDSPRWIGDCYE